MGSTCGLPTAATTRCRRSTPRAGRSWRHGLRTPASRASRSVPEGCGSATRGARTSCGWTPISRRATARCEWAPRSRTHSDRRSQTRWPSARAPSGWVADTGPSRGSTRRRSSWSTTSRSGNDPVALATGPGAVWVVDQDDGTLARIDPRSANAVTWATQVGQSPVALAVGEDAVWVASSQSDTVSRVDPESGAVTAAIPVGRRPTGVATGAGAVWVANSLDGTVSRIDPETNQVAATIAVGEAPRGVTFADDRVWVSVQSGEPPPPADASLGARWHGSWPSPIPGRPIPPSTSTSRARGPPVRGSTTIRTSPPLRERSWSPRSRPDPQRSRPVDGGTSSASAPAIGSPRRRASPSRRPPSPGQSSARSIPGWVRMPASW